MKKSNVLLLIFKTINAICLIVLFVSCSKKEDTPAPKNSSVITTPTPIVQTAYNICGDSICKLPFRLMSVFIPSGFYNSGEQSTTLTFDSTGEASTYPLQSIRIIYTNHGSWGWGASFLNENNWAGTFKITPAATKITFYVKSNYSANVTFNAFGNELYGKRELYKLPAPITPVWEKITINLLGKPASFTAPLNIIIDGVTNGQVTTVDIKDLLFE